MSKGHVRSPLTWVGGKARLLGWLLPQLDTPCHSFIDVFGGSATVLLSRPRSPVEVYNDLDGALVVFLLCVRDHPAELRRLLEGMPYARSIHEMETLWLRGGAPGRLTDLHFAARWFWLNLTGFGGQLDAGFGIARGLDAGQSHVHKQHHRLALLATASARLRDVCIECDDWRTILDRYDKDGALFYLDPPYIGTEDAYAVSGGWQVEEHAALAQRLASLQGKAAVSYFAHPQLAELYPPPKWRRYTTERLVTLGNAHAGGTPKTVTELLLCNYDQPQQGRLAL